MHKEYPKTLVLNELFEYFPKKLTLFGKCADFPIYSNDIIQNTTAEWVSKSNITRNISKTVKRGMDARKILIGFTEPSVWAFIKRRFKVGVSKKTLMWFGWDFFGIYGEGTTLGLYSKENSTLAILLDPTINIFGKSLRSIPSIIAHELCHKAAADNTKDYLRLLLDPVLVPYYSAVFKRLHEGLDNINKNLLKTAITNVTIEAEGDNSENSTLTDITNHWENLFRECGLTKEEAEICIQKLLIPFFKYILNESMSDFSKELQKRVGDFLENYYLGYDAINVRDTRNYTLASQESVFTSEVIAIANEWGIDSNTVNLINKLEF